MSSELRAWLPLLVAVALLAAGCGNKKDPQPPPRLVPAAAADLQVAQRGQELQLSFAYPALTTGGLALPGLEAVELWQLVRPLRPPLAPEDEQATGDQEEAVPEEPAEPATAPEPAAPGLFRPPSDVGELPAEQRIQVGALELTALGEVVLRLEGPELAAAIAGDRVLVRLPLPEPPLPDEAPEEEVEVLVLAVTSTSTKNLRSGLSNLVKIRPRVPPPSPAALVVRPEAGGIRLTWQADDPAVGFRLYRRDAASRSYSSPLAVLEPGAREYLDASAGFGARFVYSLTAVGREDPLLESALAAEREIDYRDRYPPPAPTGLIILAEPGQARLLWEPSIDSELAGYLIYRQEAGGRGFVALNAEPQLELGYRDTAVESGRTYSYYVSAVDRSGNESEASATATAEVP